MLFFLAVTHPFLREVKPVQTLQPGGQILYC